MLKKKVIHDRYVSYEDDDQVRSGASYLRDLDRSEADEIFRKAKDSRIGNFEDENGRDFQLLYMGSPDGRSRYMIVRRGYHNDSVSWF